MEEVEIPMDLAFEREA
eukprot:gene5089-biopygen12961